MPISQSSEVEKALELATTAMHKLGELCRWTLLSTHLCSGPGVKSNLQGVQWMEKEASERPEFSNGDIQGLSEAYGTVVSRFKSGRRGKGRGQYRVQDFLSETETLGGGKNDSIDGSSPLVLYWPHAIGEKR